jgi:hypothetical protein
VPILFLSPPAVAPSKCIFSSSLSLLSFWIQATAPERASGAGCAGGSARRRAERAREALKARLAVRARAARPALACGRAASGCGLRAGAARRWRAGRAGSGSSSSAGAGAARVARERWVTGGRHRRSGCAGAKALERGRRCRGGAAARAGVTLARWSKWASGWQCKHATQVQVELRARRGGVRVEGGRPH